MAVGTDGGGEAFYGDACMPRSWHPSSGGIIFWMESLCSAEKFPIHLTLEAQNPGTSWAEARF